jgi:subtilase family serine protease
MSKTGCVCVLIALVGCAESERSPVPDASVQVDDVRDVPEPSAAGACSGARWSCYAQVRTDGAGRVQSFATASGLGPAEIESAYALDPTRGTGATIAIVDAYAYPAAESDLAAYRKKFRLPSCTTASGCLRVVNQRGKPSPMPPRAPSGDDWTVEAALDLDAASAACPRCKLLLILADDDQGSGLYAANDTAAALGATVISNSWGGPDDGDAAALEAHFAHAGHAYFAASGDAGYTGIRPDYPSTSAHVTAVGGTRLARSAQNARGWSETAWSDAGSSCSDAIARPSYQAKRTTTCANRAAADVSAVADPATGLAVYNAGAGGWIVVGGTSAACPIVAATYALTGHGRAGPAFAYAHKSSYFDVTSGRNGTCGSALCEARAGWDGPTGLGSPNGAALIGSSETAN